MESSIDLSTYYSPEEVDGYEVFIGPEGEYYKVKKIKHSLNNITHYEWAVEYFKQNELDKIVERFEDVIKKKHYQVVEINLLVDMFGFVRYTHCNNYSNPIIDLPNKAYFGISTTKKQIDAIYNLIGYNKEYLNDDQINMLSDSEEIIYQEISTKIFEKALLKVIA